MCGIVGFTGETNRELILKMNNSQTHRGPDGDGYFVSKQNHVTLAMRRLSILDLEGGSQPMSNTDGSVWIIFNGEIYNSPALRTKLQESGMHFKTKNSDTEVVIHLYEKYGVKLLEHLNGMFAFVIYDKSKDILFGARDRLGIKPFYYTFDEGRFAFASELKALLALPWVRRELDHQAVFHYLSFQAIPAPFSIFKTIRKITPATYFRLNLKSLSFQTQRYWEPRFGTILPVSQDELPAYVRHEFENAVQRWILSDVPLACSLSGGIDSSSIVGIVAQQTANSRLKTFSLGFEDALDLDETKLARKVADKWRTDHHEIIIRPDDLLDDLDSMIYHLDEPYAGGLPSWFVFKEMSKEVKVGLTGTGGDELFGNYGKWIPFISSAERFKKLLTSHAHYNARLKDFLKYRIGSAYHIYFKDSYKRDHLLLRSFAYNLSSSEALVEQYWEESTSSDPRNAVPSVDMRIQLPEEFLHMTDRFSMAHSLEARTPFLDHEFIEKMFQIPAEKRTQKKQLKYLFIQAIYDLLPEEHLSAKKRGFILPVDRWIRKNLRSKVEEVFSKSYLRNQQIFQEDLYDRIVRPHMESSRDQSWQIWTIFMFQLWFEKFVK